MGRKPAVIIGIGNPYRCDDGIGPAAGPRWKSWTRRAPK